MSNPRTKAFAALKNAREKIQAVPGVLTLSFVGAVIEAAGAIIEALQAVTEWVDAVETP